MDLSMFFDLPDDYSLDSKYLEEYKTWSKSKCIAFLRSCDDFYHSSIGDINISDDTYDVIKSYAKNKWSTDRYFKSVGSEKIRGIKVAHRYILGSLDKTKPDINDSQYIGKWLSKYNSEDEVIITPKLDGLSLYAEYNNQKLELSATRGNGSEGQNITQKSLLFLPLNIKYPEMYCFRGEILLTGNDHIELGLKNRRNGASGIIGSDSLDNCDKLKVLFYEFIDSEGDKNPNDMLEEDRLEFIKNTFGVDYSIWWEKVKIKEISSTFLISLLNKWNEEYLDRYDFDGLVLTLNKSIREDVYIPEDKVSFKFNEEKAIGIVKEVKWETSRTGRVVPVVILKEPVELSGALVQKATGYNAKFIVDNNLKENVKIEICRSGNVIPKILSVVKE